MTFFAPIWLRLFGIYWTTYTTDLESETHFVHGGCEFRVGDVISTGRFVGKIMAIGRLMHIAKADPKWRVPPLFRQTIVINIIIDREALEPLGAMTWVFFWPAADQCFELKLLETLAALDDSV